MDFSEKWGRSVDEAVELALKDLKLTREEVEVTVIEEPSKGFFGLGSKLAKVRVEKRSGQKAQRPEVPRQESQRQERPARNERPERPARNEQPERPARPARGSDDMQHVQEARTGLRPDARRESKPAQLNEEAAESDARTEDESREGKRRRDDRRKRSRDRNRESVRVRQKPEDLQPIDESPALDFLKEMTQHMGLDVEVQAMANDECLYFDISGKDSGTIIGKRGQTLDSIQYLASLVANKEKETYKRVIVDAENYREKRERTLEQLANRLADKVQRSGKSVRLEPMNPYERKVIHATLQKYPGVTTRSEGEEPYRRVIIEQK